MSARVPIVLQKSFWLSGAIMPATLKPAETTPKAPGGVTSVTGPGQIGNDERVAALLLSDNGPALNDPQVASVPLTVFPAARILPKLVARASLLGALLARSGLHMVPIKSHK